MKKFKNKTMRFLFCLMMLNIVAYSGIVAQEFQTENDKFQIENFKEINSSVYHSSVIRYEDHASILFELSTTDLSRNFKIIDSNGKIVTEYYGITDYLNISNLDYNRPYTLIHTDPYTEEEYSYKFDINQELESSLNVSPDMFEIIAEFTQQDKLSIEEYLDMELGENNFKSISILQIFIDEELYEDISKNKSIKISNEQFLTASPRENILKNGRRDDDACKCIVTATANAVPVGNPAMNGNYINPTIVNNAPGNMGNNTYGWTYNYEKGPAKAHLTRTSGKNAGGAPKSWTPTFNVNTNSNFSPLKAEVSYTLACVGYGNKPVDCDCQADVNINATYNTKLEARAVTKSGGFGDKNAEALAQDMAILVERNQYGTEATVVAANMASAEVACSSTVNSTWFVDVLELAGTIAGAAMTGAVTPATINTFVNQLTSIITSNPIDYTGTCGVEGGISSLLNEQFVKTLYPNRAVYYELYSATNSRTGGKRRWESHAHVVSDFSLAGVVPGTRAGGAQFGACCMDATANWIFAGAHGSPLQSSDINRNVGQFIKSIWTTFNLPISSYSNIYVLPSEWGFTEESICGNTPPGGLGDLTDPNDDINKRSTLDNSIIELQGIYNLSGQLIQDLSDKSQVTKSQLVSDLQANYQGLPSGIYLMTYVEDGIVRSEKISIANE